MNWSDRPARAHLRYKLNDGHVYEIGRYEITVTIGKEPAEAVTYRADRSFGSPEKTFPNMEIEDGTIKIPVSDFLDELMARATPLELAAGLFESEEVRACMIDALARRYSSDGFTDTDRRAFLHKVQVAVHSQAVDALANRLADLEWYNSQSYYAHKHTSDVNRWLSDHGFDLRMPYDDEGDFKAGGKVWQQARDDWRALVLASFPAPPDEPAAEQKEPE